MKFYHCKEIYSYQNLYQKKIVFLQRYPLRSLSNQTLGFCFIISMHKIIVVFLFHVQFFNNFINI